MMVAAGMLTLALLLHAFSWVVLRASRRHDERTKARLDHIAGLTASAAFTAYTEGFADGFETGALTR